MNCTSSCMLSVAGCDEMTRLQGSVTTSALPAIVLIPCEEAALLAKGLTAYPFTLASRSLLEAVFFMSLISVLDCFLIAWRWFLGRKKRSTWVHWTSIDCCSCSWSKAPAVSWSGAAGLPCRGQSSSWWQKWLRVEEKTATKFPCDATLAQVKVAQEAGEPISRRFYFNMKGF